MLYYGKRGPAEALHGDLEHAMAWIVQINFKDWSVDWLVECLKRL